MTLPVPTTVDGFRAILSDRAAIKSVMRRVALNTLISLAYGEHAETPFYDVPDALASLAYDEIERRQSAMSRLFADVPNLARALNA